MTAFAMLLNEAAGRWPGKLAVEEAESGQGFTYAELDRRADGVCRQLERLGIGPGDRVGVWAPKSLSVVVALYGVLKAGAAYVPVDPSGPEVRNRQILDDCGVKALILDSARLRGAPGGQSQSLEGTPELLVLQTAAREAPTTEPPEGLAYVLYTSGSTGRPKGVMHTRESAMGFVRWGAELLAVSGAERFASHAPFHFDLSILDVFVPATCGATLVLFGEEVGRTPQDLAPLMAARRVTVWYSTPTVLRLLLDHGKLDRYDYSSLRTVCFAGEVFPARPLRELARIWRDARYFNLYGPTETNVCTFYEVPVPVPEDRAEPFPIGRACSSCEIRLLDSAGAPEPGAQGELCVRGDSLMAGYWNLPEQTREAFFVDEQGGRWYKTGDVVGCLPDGNLFFVGRHDRMVKRRGARVELGEIERALYGNPDVREAATVASTDAEGVLRITAFVTVGRPGAASVLGMKQFCAQRLPASMIPDRFRFVEALPRTSTDKTDYQALLALA